MICMTERTGKVNETQSVKKREKKVAVVREMQCVSSTDCQCNWNRFGKSFAIFDSLTLTCSVLLCLALYLSYIAIETLHHSLSTILT